MSSSSALIAAGRRAGYSLTAVAFVGVWFVLNVAPGWQALDFLTGGFGNVITMLNASLLVAVVANLAYSLYDVDWLRGAGGLLTSGLGLAVLVLLWREFPFAVDGAWNDVLRGVLVVSMVGTVIDLLLQGATLLRAAALPPGARRDAHR